VTDPDAVTRFTSIYDDLYSRVYAYAVSRTGRQLAEEVTSETFAVAWRRFADLPDPPLPWLLGVARNVLRESYRAQVRQDSLRAELRAWTSDAELSVGDIGEDVVERSAVLRGLAALSDEDRELLTLIAWHGLSAAQAAKVIGCSKATFFVRLHRARKRLERALADTPAPVPPPRSARPAAQSTARHTVRTPGRESFR
jgi:RNA polymerase sigma-70 factor (ECF subfamily)